MSKVLQRPQLAQATSPLEKGKETLSDAPKPLQEQEELVVKIVLGLEVVDHHLHAPTHPAPAPLPKVLHLEELVAVVVAPHHYWL